MLNNMGQAVLGTYRFALRILTFYSEGSDQAHQH